MRTANKASLAEQADLGKRLDTSTGANADVAIKAQSTVAGTAARLARMLVTLRDEWRAEVRGKLTDAAELLESESQRVEKYLEQEQKTLGESVERQAENQERLLREEMTAFKEEMKRNLAEHQQGIDRELTGFLNKQNALGQKLSPQIDSFSRALPAQSADLATTNRKFGELASAFSVHEATATNELSALAAGIRDLKTRLGDVQAGLRSQGESVSVLGASLQETSTQLGQTIEVLRVLPFVGGKFKIAATSTGG